MSERGIPVFIRSQNGTNQSFKGRLRDECLNVEWFRTRREARIVIEAWRRHYNAVRPHSSLDYSTPLEFSQPQIPNRAISQESVVRNF